MVNQLDLDSNAELEGRKRENDVSIIEIGDGTGTYTNRDSFSQRHRKGLL